MALINNRHMSIFFHLYKCGGNSVRKVMPQGVELHGVHVAPTEILHHYKVHGKEDKFNEMFKFTFVRNPFNFLLSTFYYATIFKNHFMHNDIKGMDMDKFVPYYMKVVEEHKDPLVRPFGSNKVTTLFQYISDKDGKVLVDYVGKLETINPDMKIVHAKLGIKPLSSPVPVVNKTKIKSGHYRKHYSPQARKLVEKHFEKDLNYFNYEF